MRERHECASGTNARAARMRCSRVRPGTSEGPQQIRIRRSSCHGMNAGYARDGNHTMDIYVGVTAELADPRRPFVTVLFCGFAGYVNSPLYVLPPTLVSVPSSWPVDVTTETVSVAVVLLFVTSTLRTRSMASPRIERRSKRRRTCGQLTDADLVVQSGSATSPKRVSSCATERRWRG
jgi:hypothetical protein